MIIGSSDILIAGIAISNDLVLITNNLKHYEPISKFKIEKWKIGFKLTLNTLLRSKTIHRIHQCCFNCLIAYR